LVGAEPGISQQGLVRLNQPTNHFPANNRIAEAELHAIGLLSGLRIVHLTDTIHNLHASTSSGKLNLCNRQPSFHKN
jgi:hypothetical protein